jgi:hypothetical protein
MQRVIAYVDGFNLYFGLKQSGFRRYYWLDLAMLARHLLKPNQQLVATHYFTARIRDNGRNAADQKTRKVVRQPQATPVEKRLIWKAGPLCRAAWQAAVEGLGQLETVRAYISRTGL